MVQLIISLLAIMLTAATVLAGINYVPWWAKTATITEEQVLRSMSLLEQGYDLVVRSADGAAPAVSGSADGGLMASFGSVLKFQPAAPVGFDWVYGKNTVTGSRYEGLNYFCLKPKGTAGPGEGIGRGLMRAKAVYSADQVVVNSTCGASSSAVSEDGFPNAVALTLYVVYTPGVSR